MNWRGKRKGEPPEALEVRAFMASCGYLILILPGLMPFKSPLPPTQKSKMCALAKEPSEGTPEELNGSGHRSRDALDQRLELLGELVPPVVHELNNHMAVLRGVLEILLHDKQDPSGQQAIEASVAASDLLVRLASYAKSDDGRRGPLDPATALEEFAPLLRAYAKSKGIRFDLFAPLGVSNIQGDPRAFWRSMSSIAMLFAMHAQVEGLASRMAITLGTGERFIRIRITATSGNPDLLAELAPALGGLRDAVERLDACVWHSLKSAVGLELRLPATIRGDGVSSSHRAKARVLLLGVGEDFEDELEELLRESGYVVLRPSTEVEPVALLVSTAADVLLMDVRVLSESSELMLRFVEGRVPNDLGVVLLGDGGSIGDLRSLPNPCPPGELLAAIEKELSRP